MSFGEEDAQPEQEEKAAYYVWMAQLPFQDAGSQKYLQKGPKQVKNKEQLKN